MKVYKCEAEIEKGMAKLRWSRWKEEEGENDREYAYDIESKTMNFRKMRPTEMQCVDKNTWTNLNSNYEKSN